MRKRFTCLFSLAAHATWLSVLLPTIFSGSDYERLGFIDELRLFAVFLMVAVIIEVMNSIGRNRLSDGPGEQISWFVTAMCYATVLSFFAPLYSPRISAAYGWQYSLEESLRLTVGVGTMLICLFVFRDVFKFLVLGTKIKWIEYEFSTNLYRSPGHTDYDEY